MPRIFKRESVQRDLIERFVWLAENASLRTADRFLKNAEASFNDLAGQPLIGTPLTLKNPALAGLRKWRVKRFPKYLIFYVPVDGGVSIVRVLHAAQDWWSLLDIEP